MPRDWEIAAEDALFLPAFDQRDEEGHDRLVAAVEFLGGQAARVDRKQRLEIAQLVPGGAEHSLYRFFRLAVGRFGFSRRFGNLRDGVFHHGVEQ